MGLLDSLFGGGGPSPRKIDGTTRALKARHGEPARRYQAAERLAEWRTPYAVDGLLSRYTVTVEAETSDDEEKAYVSELLDKIGAELVVPAIDRYLRREAQVSWPLRILARMVTPEEFRSSVSAVLATLDVHFDRQPERKVETLHALMEHCAHREVSDAAAPFLDDTDDTVRMAAAELIAKSDREDRGDLLVSALAQADDRPRVLDAICRAMADNQLSVKGRKAEVEPMLPEGFYLTRQGAVKRLGS